MTIEPLPAALAALFVHKATISLPELCAGLPMDDETVLKHIAAGHLVAKIKGFGRKRPRRCFTEAAVRDFLCALNETEAAPSSISSSPRSRSLPRAAFPESFP